MIDVSNAFKDQESAASSTLHEQRKAQSVNPILLAQANARNNSGDPTDTQAVPSAQYPAPQFVVMGVSGCGKTTIGLGLATKWGIQFRDADDLHPAANIAKMAAGKALDDADRAPWLQRIAEYLTHQAVAGRSTIVACSALKRSYRDILRTVDAPVVFIHLTLSESVTKTRLAARVGHFMPLGLLPSQLATLEPLDDQEQGVTISNAHPPDDVIASIDTWVHEADIHPS